MQSCICSDSGAVVTHHYTTPLNDLPDSEAVATHYLQCHYSWMCTHMHMHVYTSTHMHRVLRGFIYTICLHINRGKREEGWLELCVYKVVHIYLGKREEGWLKNKTP